MKNKTMINIYRICFIILLIILLFISALGFANEMLFKISILLGIICILTFILLLFEILEDYFNKKIDLIVNALEDKLNKKEQGDEQNGNVGNKTTELSKLDG